MNQTHFEISAIGNLYLLQFFAAFVECIEFEFSGVVIEPMHALGCSSPRAGGHNHFQSAKVAAAIGLLPAKIEPEQTQRENSVDHGTRLRCTHANHRVSSGSAQ